MRGIPKILQTKADIENLARDLPVLQAAALVRSIAEETWARLHFTAEEMSEVQASVDARLEREDRATQYRQARVQALGEQIALRTEADGFARDARRLREEIDDLALQLDDHRAEGVEEALLVDTVKRRDELNSLFGSILTKHQQWMGRIAKLRKKVKDAEEV